MHPFLPPCFQTKHHLGTNLLDNMFFLPKIGENTLEEVIEAEISGL